MKVVSALFFWLGSTDSRVASGIGKTGGTHDIRFCSRGDEVRLFTGSAASASGHWSLPLQRNAALGVPTYTLRISEYKRRRAGECALPQQHASSVDPYPLCAMTVRPIKVGDPPLDAIALLRDSRGSIHARVVPRERLQCCPLPIRAELEHYDECARLYAGAPLLFPEECFSSAVPRKRVRTAPEESIVAQLEALTGRVGTVESKSKRHRRSRRLAEKLKELYGYRCQLCGDTSLAIKTVGGGSYVEVHHILGLAEVDPADASASVSQQGASLSLDHYKNLIVVCAHHHAVLHHDHRRFDYDSARKVFKGLGDAVLELRHNKHL